MQGIFQASWPLLLMLGIFYFILWRPQKKEEKKRNSFLESLKKGDRIITIGGVHGTITGFTEKTAMLRIADKVEIEIARVSIGQYQDSSKKVAEHKNDAKTDSK